MALLTTAITQFDANDMALDAAAARWRQGQLLGGDAGLALVAEAGAWMTAQGVKHPVRMTAMLALAFRDSMSQRAPGPDGGRLEARSPPGCRSSSATAGTRRFTHASRGRTGNLTARGATVESGGSDGRPRPGDE